MAPTGGAARSHPDRSSLRGNEPRFRPSRHGHYRGTAPIPDRVIVAWYPIKDERQVAAWQTSLVRGGLSGETLAAELWLYPRDSRVALNGSGMLIVNPPYLLAERMRVWLPELQAQLDTGRTGGSSIRALTPA